MLKLHTVCHTTARLCSRNLAAELAWLLSRPFNYWVHHETQKFKIWGARILYQTRVSLPKVQQLASLPKHLWTVIHSGKHGPVTILTRLPSHSKWNTQISKLCVFCVLLWIKIGYMNFFFFFPIMCSNVFWKWGSGLWFNWKLRNMIKYSNAIATRKRAVTQRTVYSILLFDSNGTIIYKIIIVPLSVRLESSGWNYKCNRKVFCEVTSSEVWDNCFFFFLQTKIFLKWSEHLKLVTLWRLAKIEQV